jgi:hypothetical protein
MLSVLQSVSKALERWGVSISHIAFPPHLLHEVHLCWHYPTLLDALNRRRHRILQLYHRTQTFRRLGQPGYLGRAQ